MKTFKDIFSDWIEEKTETQVDFISEYCENIGINPKEWFSFYINRHGGDCSGDNILTDMGETFAFYLLCELEKLLLKYIEPSGYNIYKEPYLCMEMDFQFKNDELFIKKSDKKKFKKFCEKLTLDQKIEFSKNKIYSYISSKTKLNIFNKREIRFLKLKTLNEYSRSDNES